MPVSFVSFNKRRAASVAAQTQQCRDATKLITQLAPEPKDVAWANLSIRYTELTVRQLIINVSLFFLIFFYLIPVTFVQSLANLESLKKKLTFLRPILNVNFIDSVIQGFLPGLALKIFLAILPQLLIFMSNIEGWISKSIIERKSAGKFFYFMLINVFFGSVLTGSLFQQFKSILSSPSSIPKLFGSSVPSKASFFQTYIMVDGWLGTFVELARLSNLIIYHIKSMLLVRTPQDRDKAMSVEGVRYVEIIPRFELYFLLGVVYSVITPLLIPFILIFFFFAYFVYRNQVINVYEPEYESSGAFWPHVHGRMVCALIVQQLTMIGLLALKKAVSQGPWLLPLPIVTLVVHYVFCKGKFENAFTVYALEEAVKKDLTDEQKLSDEKDKNKKDQTKEIRRYLKKAYLHPSLRTSYELDEEKGGDDGSLDDSNVNGADEFEDGTHLVPLKRYPMASKVAKPKLNAHGVPNSIYDGVSLSASSFSSHASLGTNHHEEDLS